MTDFDTYLLLTELFLWIQTPISDVVRCMYRKMIHVKTHPWYGVGRSLSRCLLCEFSL